MAVDVIPLGLPELGMTRAEILEHSNTMLDIYYNSAELFYTLLFAYVVSMYLAGSQLSRMQYIIANAMYLIVIGTTAFAGFGLLNLFYVWGDYAGLNKMAGAGSQWVHIDVVTKVVLITLSIWFGRRIRHPKPG